MDIGSAIRRIRLEACVSQVDAAAQLDVSAVHLCNVEAGRKLPSLDLIERVRGVFGEDPYVRAISESDVLESIKPKTRQSVEKLMKIWANGAARQASGDVGVEPAENVARCAAG